MKGRRKEERKSCTSYNNFKNPHLAAGENYKNLNPRNSLVWLVSWHKKLRLGRPLVSSCLNQLGGILQLLVLMLHGPCPQAKGVYTVAAETLPCRCHVCRCGGCLCVWLAQCGDGKWPSHSGTCTRLYQYSTLCYSPLVFQARSPSFLQSLSLDWCLSKKRGPSGAAQSLAAAHERWICQQKVAPEKKASSQFGGLRPGGTNISDKKCCKSRSLIGLACFLPQKAWNMLHGVRLGRPLVSSCLRHADAAWHGPQAKGVYIGQSVSAAMPLPRVWLWRLPLRVADTLWAGQVAEPFRDVCKTVQHALATLRLRFNQGPQAFSIYTVTVFGLDAFQRNSWSICCWPVHALEAKSSSGSCLRTYPVYSKSLGLSTRGLPSLPQKRKASSEMGPSLVV